MKKNNKGTFKKLISMLGKYKLLFIISLLLAAATVAMTLYIPILTGDAIDCIVSEGNVAFDAITHIIIKNQNTNHL